MDYKDTHIEIGKLVNKEAKAKKQADSEIRELDKFHKDIQDDASIVSISMINDNHKARYLY